MRISFEEYVHTLPMGVEVILKQKTNFYDDMLSKYDKSTPSRQLGFVIIAFNFDIR